MKIPENVKKFECELYTMWLDNDILCMNAKSVDVNIRVAQESFELMRRICGGKKGHLLIDTSHAHYVNRDVRTYVAEQLPNICVAVATVSSTKFGALLVNIFLSLNGAPVPIKLFPGEDEAKEWLKKMEIR